MWRFPRSLYSLFQRYATAASRVQCFYNAERQSRLIFEQRGAVLAFADPTLYKQLQQEVGL